MQLDIGYLMKQLLSIQMLHHKGVQLRSDKEGDTVDHL